MSDNLISGNSTLGSAVSENAVSGKSKNTGLIATMPRSGTWYINTFFWFYIQLLRGKTELELPLDRGLLHAQNIEKKGRRIDINVNELLILHAVCPGFYHYQGQYRQAWDELNFYTEGFNIAEKLIKISEKTDFDPTLNKNVRIVYCCRNPLDQAVSFFRHIQKHENSKLRYYVDSDGKESLIKNVREYILNVGLESYIKQFFTFKAMKQMCPDNILMIKYENLARSPEHTFASILNHFGRDINSPYYQEEFAIALKLSSKDSVKEMEKIGGHSIGNDQSDPKESHMRGGAIGKWKKHLNNEDIKIVQQRLGCFGISLDEFDIE